MHPHIKSLITIKVYPFGGQDLTIYRSFLDLIVLAIVWDLRLKIKACFFKDSELKEINPIYESFKRIARVYCDNYEEALAMLNILEQTSIQEIEDIVLWEIDGEDFEKITNRLLNYKIHTLKHNYKIKWESISNQTLENISKINPQELHRLILNI